MIGFDPHDHSRCVRAATDAADRMCAEAGLRLTPVRRRVLSLLLERHRALGAYDILDVLRAEGLGSQPPVAYRALDFLTTHGLAHRIERLNAFVACAAPGADHDPAFLICRKCDRVAETEAALPPVADGFEVEAAVVEMQGLCADCRDA